MTDEEQATALSLSSKLPPDRVKAVHAQVYANLLMEVARDGSVGRMKIPMA